MIHLSTGSCSESPATIAIVARNAGATIERAIRSCLEQGPCPILLVDDNSSDDTAARALGTAGDRLRVIRPGAHRTVGFARQTAVDSIATPYAVWLDADDELLPGRVESVVAALCDGGFDLVSDGVELYDGVRGTLRAVLPVPAFLTARFPPARQFERNYLPGIGVPGIHVPFARRLGYDAFLQGAEDMDFFLRAVAAGARVAFLDTIGYRLHAYPGSLSRDIVRQREMYRDCLRKHDYAMVLRLYREAGYDERVAAWGLVSMAVYREDYPAALRFLDRAESGIVDPGEVLEPDGPCPMPEGWRLGFQRGTVLLLCGCDSEAREPLETAAGLQLTAEVANNLGVLRIRMGDAAGAMNLFKTSLEIFPGFHDASANLEGILPLRITTHPLRSGSARNDYAPCMPRDTLLREGS